jgi:aspartate carbamoyltransferase catalytic subunit
MEPIKLKHLLSVEDLSNTEVLNLIDRANRFKNGFNIRAKRKSIRIKSIL